MQEEALLAWFTSDEGLMVCAPTGTGKTVIAEAALFEALHTGKTAYYTTPLIALTEQKFREMQEAAVRWGFPEEAVGLVTGNRCVNGDAQDSRRRGRDPLESLAPSRGVRFHRRREPW